MDKCMIITALDYDNAESALSFATKLDPSLSKVKVGKELFTRAGPQLVEELQKQGFDVFLDLKFHDIPNTVAGALKAAASLGVWMVNVHASGGPRMLDAARNAIPVAGNRGGTRLIAVTVLTSMDDAELHHVGVHSSAEQQVKKLAQLSLDCGLDGVVCSAQEVSIIRSIANSQFLTVTPGIRLAENVGSENSAPENFASENFASENTVPQDDQRRVMTPQEAIAAGSSYLVIGRPITQSSNPLNTLKTIHTQIAS